jgi:hypothetical protein
MPNLVAALDDATVLECPVLPTRHLPPTLTQHRGGFLRQLRPSWHEQSQLVARRCHHLRPPQQHRLLPPSYPLPLERGCNFLQGEGMPIHYEHVDLVFTVDMHASQAMSLHLPTSWPSCSQSRGASYLQATSSASRSQPIYS